MDTNSKMTVKDFDLAQTLECGQCFNFEKTGEEEYLVIAFGKLLHIKQTPHKGKYGPEYVDLDFGDTSDEDILKIWIPYFDLERDYSAIKRAVSEADPRLAPVIERFGGVRILNQEFPETLISFIISQNKNIPQIKKIVRAICDCAGDYAGTFGEREYHAFPRVEQLQLMCEEEFRLLKTGFRAPYIMNAILRLSEPSFNRDALSQMDYEDARRQLLEIRGVGDKVAGCVLLFSLGFRSAFPVDVWIKRIMEEMYFHEDTNKKVIENFARKKFGEYGGYAQQYLFMYARDK